MATRFYAFTPGAPGYISAEVAVRDLKGADEARRWAADWWNGPDTDGRIISRCEALMRPAYRTALEGTPRRQRDAGDRGRPDPERSAVGIAELGCREAASALATGDDERIYAVVSDHGHDERCGGHYFADDPRSRRFTVISRARGRPRTRCRAAATDQRGRRHRTISAA